MKHIIYSEGGNSSGGQAWRMWWMWKQFEVELMDFDFKNYRRVYPSIFWMKDNVSFGKYGIFFSKRR